MKIAVTSSGATEESAIDERFGRAKYFIIHDTESGESHTIDNESNLNRQQGAGIQAAELVLREGAGVVLTGHCGPKAFKTLKAAGIEIVIGCSGTVKTMIDSYKQGDLKPVDAPDVDMHW